MGVVHIHRMFAGVSVGYEFRLLVERQEGEEEAGGGSGYR